MTLGNLNLFIIIFFALFGPKIGIIDLSVLIPIFFIPIILIKKRNIKFHFLFILILGVVTFNLAYTTLIYNLTDHNLADINFVLRSYRSLVSTIVLGLIFYNLNNSINSIIKITIFAIFIHAFSIFVQLFIPATLGFFAEYWTLGKYPPFLRAFGLTAGLDTSGYMLIFGQVLAIMMSIKRENIYSYLLIYVFFLIAALFTARNAFFISLILYFIFLFYLIKFKGFFIKFYSYTSFTLVLILISNIIIPVILYTFFNGQNLISFFSLEVNLNTAYSQGTLNDLFTRHIVFNNSLLDLMFGNGEIPPMDPGYLRVFWGLGIIGLFSYIIFYGVIILIFWNLKKIVNKNYLITGNQLYSLNLSFNIILVFTILIFIFNFKHFYFFTRGFYELLIIYVFFSLGLFNQANRAKGFKL